MADKLFPDELILPQRQGMKPKIETNFFWEFNGVEFYFFLNYSEVRYTAILTKNCIIIRVPPRILETNNNILIIKMIRRSEELRIKPNQVVNYWLSEQSSKIIMIGIVGVNCKKAKSKVQNVNLEMRVQNHELIIFLIAMWCANFWQK